jgi:expansin (peptidoglycan-binding protein)
VETSETQLVEAPKEALDHDSAAPDGHRGRRRRPRGWLVWGAPTLIAVAVLASVLMLVGAMRGLSDAACAAEPVAKPAALPAAVPAPGASHSGNATFFDLAASGGSGCSYDGAPADDMYVALSLPEFTNGAGCGIYLNVTGPNGNTVRVQVVDSCGPCAVGHIDLSQKAFSQLADPDIGDISVSYKTVVNPALPGPLKFKMSDVNEYYFSVLPLNHGNELTSVVANGTSLTRNGDGFWVANNGVGGGPFTIKLTDVLGHVRTVSGVELLASQTQSTGVYMYSGSGGSYDTGGGTTTTRKRASASPSVKATPTPKRTLDLPGAIAATAAPTGPAVGRPDAITSAAADPKKTC